MLGIYIYILVISPHMYSILNVAHDNRDQYPQIAAVLLDILVI